MTNSQLKDYAKRVEQAAQLVNKKNQDLTVLLIAAANHFGGKLGISKQEIDGVAPGDSFSYSRDEVTGDMRIVVEKAPHITNN